MKVQNTEPKLHAICQLYNVRPFPGLLSSLVSSIDLQILHDLWNDYANKPFSLIDTEQPVGNSTNYNEI